MRTTQTGKFVLLAFISAVFSFASCSDWTDAESIKIVQPNIKEQNPELYAKYLEELRVYKNSDHKLVHVWFDNSEKTPFTRAQHIADLPDSVDFVALMHPDNLVEYELAEMKSIRADKGIKVIYTIDFEAIKSAYNAKMEMAAETEPIAQKFEDFLVDSLEYALSLAHKYAYDGICIGYSGKSMIHMEPNERTEYTLNERIFIGILENWYKRNSQKTIIFKGNPQNLIDKSLLKNAQTIIVSGEKATNEDMLTYYLSLAAVLDVPQERLGMIVSATSLNDPNKEIGYFTKDKTAMQGLADWAPTIHNGIEIAGVGIYNVSTDYYQSSRSYHYTRLIISRINPSVK